MNRRYTSGASGTPPSLSDLASAGYPTNGSPGVTAATKPGAAWFHMITESLMEVLSAAGVTPDHTDTTKLLDAIIAMACGGSSVKGALCAPNAVSPTSKLDMAAREVVFLNPNPSVGRTLVVTGPTTKTVDVGSAGPVAGGRDQSSAFSAGSWVHFYWIAKTDGTYHGIASATGPSGGGPTLPSGYTMWAYAGTVRFSGSSALVRTYIRGSKAFFAERQSVLAAGSATVETAINLSSLVPSEALAWFGAYRMGITSDGSGVLSYLAELRVLSGYEWFKVQSAWTNAATGAPMVTGGGELTVPNIAQNAYYLITVVNGSAQNLSVDVLGYVVPNGGE